MNKYTIHKPIWDGGYKERCIGIAEFRLPCIVDISYRDKYDNLVHPGKFVVTQDFAQKFDKKKVGASTEVRVIPISKLEKYKEPPVLTWLDFQYFAPIQSNTKFRMFSR